MDTRNRIIDTASHLFYTQGYTNTGINQVIKEAGIAKSSLYQHFPSKEDLLEAYLQLTTINTNKALHSAVGQHAAPADKVLAVFDFLLEMIPRTEFNGCNFLNISSEMPQENNRIRDLIKKQKDHIRTLFASILEPLGKAQLADELYLLFDAALSSSKVYNDIWPVVSARTIAAKLL